MEALGQRIVAAAVLVPLVVAAVVWLPTAGFALLMGIFALLGALEWARLLRLDVVGRVAFVGALALALMAGYAIVPVQAAVAGVLALAAAYWLLATLWVAQFQRRERAVALRLRPVRVVAGWLCLAPAWLATVWLHLLSPALVLYLLVLIWVADSAAFFAGRRFGRRRLAPRVSPGKTVEGVVAGLAAVAALALAASVAAPFAAAPGAGGLVALSVAVAVASVLGDLAESMFKRVAGVKDSGTLIPGHGGVLDRVDSLTAAAPCFALGWMLLGAAP